MTVEELREIKEKKGFTYVQICDYSGVPLGTIIKIFSGETKNPRKSTLAAIEKMLTNPLYDSLNKCYYFDEKSKPLPTSYVNNYGESIVCEPVPAYIGRRGTYTIDDYYNLPDGVRKELIDGEFYDMASPTVVHQEIALSFFFDVQSFINSNKGPCKVYAAPIDVQIDKDDDTVVIPDAFILFDQDKNLNKKIFGAPDFILEVLSPSTRNKDMTIKLAKYRMAGVREYWIIDPKKRVLIKYNFMDEDYTPEIMPLEGETGIAIYDDKCKVNLDKINDIIQDMLQKEK